MPTLPVQNCQFISDVLAASSADGCLLFVYRLTQGLGWHNHPAGFCCELGGSSSGAKDAAGLAGQVRALSTAVSTVTGQYADTPILSKVAMAGLQRSSCKQAAVLTAAGG